MKQRAKARRKPIAEKYQTAIACSVLIGLIAMTIGGIGWFFPAPVKQPSMQEARR